jgi:hypothetical protein
MKNRDLIVLFKRIFNECLCIRKRKPFIVNSSNYSRSWQKAFDSHTKQACVTIETPRYTSIVPPKSQDREMLHDVFQV